MKAGLHIEQMLHELFAEKVSIKEKRGVGGGCINQTSVLLLSNGRKLFLKENSLTYEGLFSSERAGLIALRSEQGPRIPEPYAVGKGGGRQFLLLEYIEPGSKASDFWEEFGRLLAGLHRGRHEGRFGFGQDNYIGASPQKNSWESEWPRFFAEHRLRFQLELARSRGHSNERWMRGLEGIIERIEELLPHPEHPSLLHGDLWGGNYMVDERGRAVLIDPAVYYGDREADLAMTELFGGFDSRFYEAYNEMWPIEPGYRERKELYNLYHLLNHFNLFGGSYGGSVADVVRRFAR